MGEKEGTILIEHVSARAEVTRGPTSDVGIPNSANGWPIKPLAVNMRCFAVFRQQAKASRVTLGNILDRFSQCLKDGTRRVSQRAHQFHERAVLLFVIGWTRGAAMQLLRAQDRLQRSRASRN